MTNKELEKEIKDYLKLGEKEVGEFEVYAFNQTSSNKYKCKLIVDIRCEGYGDKGVEGYSNDLDGAIQEVVEAIIGEGDEGDNEGFAY